jgi:DNA invertase Pin-like site-specific DNA recombinase
MSGKRFDQPEFLKMLDMARTGDVISERTQAGLDAARARGRPKAIAKLEPRNLARTKELYAAKKNTITEIMQMTGFRSRNTFYKYVVNA